jgi:dienelactone hydrolase
VWVPTRVGYGESGVDEDPEYTGPCLNKSYPPSYEAAAEQALQVIEYAGRLPRIDARKVAVIGQSFGGATSVALAARGTAAIAATVNFAGGGGGDPQMRPAQPCGAGKLEDLFAGYGKTARIPTLWVYAENDRYFGAKLPRAWYEAFRANGGVGELVTVQPFGDDGHLLFARGIEVWKPIVERFLAAHAPAGSR